MAGSGSSHITGQESIIFADNASFDGTKRGGALSEDLQLWVGSSTPPHVRKKKIVAGTNITIDNTDPDEIVFSADSGAKNLVFQYQPTDFIVLEDNYASLNWIEGVNKKIAVRSFDDTIPEYVNFSFILPQNFDASGDVILRYAYFAETAASDVFVRFNFEYNNLSVTSWDVSFSSISSPDAPVNSIQNSVTRLNRTIENSFLNWNKGDLILARISRIDTDQETNLTGDLQLLSFAVEVQTE